MKLFKITLLILLQFILTSQFSHAQNIMITDLINNQEYEKAIELLTAKTTIEKMDNEALVNLGYCYIMSKDFVKAETVFSELSQRKRSPKENVLYYAELLLINGKYDEAKENYLKYLEKNPNHQLVKLKIQSCDSLKSWQHFKSNILVSGHQLINTPHHEINASVHSDQIIYASNKPDVNGVSLGKNVWKYYDENGNLFAPSVFSNYSCGAIAWCAQSKSSAFTVKRITQNIHDVSLGLSSIILVYGENIESGKVVPFEWEGMPKDINVAHPSFSLSGKRLYFASDMPGGYGGMDIYYSDYSDNKWNKPINLGSQINTAFDDLFPVVSGDSVLYFSSAGHPGYGNLDIFMSKINANQFSAPVNMKSPVNSIGDDFSFVALRSNSGYLTSNRSSLSRGGFDIFEWKIPVAKEPDIIIPEPVHVFNPQSLPLYSILFNTDSYEIGSVYEPMLKSLADSMRRHSYITIDIQGFTDITGPDSYNKDLSLHRAKSIADFLTNAGVPSSQINYHGMGKSEHANLSQLKYHVQVGSLNVSGEEEWFAKLIDNNYEVQSIPFKGKYSYVAGEFATLQEATQAQSKLRNSGTDCFIIASYMGQRLPDYILSVNRRVDIKYNKMPDKAENPGIADLQKAKAGDIVTLPAIQFYPGLSTPLESSIPTMEELAQFLNENPTVEIEIRGHICCDPNDEERLSDKRAKRVFDYLVSAGISSERMKWKGYGNTQRLTDESTPEKQQQNRRVEILIVKR